MHVERTEQLLQLHCCVVCIYLHKVIVAVGLTSAFATFTDSKQRLIDTKCMRLYTG